MEPWLAGNMAEEEDTVEEPSFFDIVEDEDIIEVEQQPTEQVEASPEAPTPQPTPSAPTEAAQEPVEPTPAPAPVDEAQEPSMFDLMEAEEAVEGVEEPAEPNVDVTDDVRAARGFGRSAAESDGSMTSLQRGTEEYYSRDTTDPEELEPVPALQVDAPDLSPFLRGDMWVGIPTDEAETAFRALKERDDVRQVLDVFAPDQLPPWMQPGAMIYTNKETGKKEYIPAPNPKYFAPAGIIQGAVEAVTPGGRGFGEVISDTSEYIRNPPSTIYPSQSARLGTLEAFGDTARTGAAVYSAATDTEAAYEFVDKAFPTYDSETFADAAIADGIPAILGLLGGMGAANKGLKVLDAATKGTTNAYVTQAARFLIGEGVAVSGTNVDEGSFFFGNIMDGADWGDTDALNNLEQKFNLMSDVIISGGLVTGAARALAPVANYVKFIFAPVANNFRKDGPEFEVYRQLSNAFGKINANTELGERAAIEADVARIINENSEIITGIVNSEGGAANIQRDTISALIKGKLPDAPEEEIIRLQRLIPAFLSADFPKFSKTNRAPISALEDNLDEQMEAMGGTRSIETASDDLGGIARDAVQETDDLIAGQQARLSEESQEFIAQIEGDENFSSIVSAIAASDGNAATFGKYSNSVSEEMAKELRTFYEGLTKRKNELGGRIEGGKIDVRETARDMLAMLPDDFSKSSNIVRKSSPIAEMQRQFAPREISAFDAFGNPTKRVEKSTEVAERVSKWLNKNGADFGFFHNKIRPELNEMAKDAFASGKGAVGKEIRKVIKYIDTEMVDQVGRTNPRLADNVELFKENYRQNYAPYFGEGSGTMGGFRTNYNKTVNRTGDGQPLDETLGVEEFGAQGFEEETQRLLNSALGEKDNPAVARRLAEMLKGAENPDLVADYVMAEALSSVALRVKKGNFADIDIDSMTAALGPITRQLAEIDPNRLGQLEQALETMTKRGQSREQIELAVDAAVKEAEATKAGIQNGALRSFIGDTDTMEATSDPVRAFFKVFREDENAGRLSKIMAEVNKLPAERQVVVTDGIRSAYQKYVKEEFLGKSFEEGQRRNLKPSKVAPALDETDNLFALGDILYKDQPEVMSVLRVLSKEALSTDTLRGAKASARSSSTTMETKGLNSVRQMVSMAFGPLSRTGNRINTVARSWVQRKEGAQQIIDLMDKVLSDPDEFVRLHNKYKVDPMAPATKEAVQRYFTGFGVKMSPLTGSAVEEDSVDQEMQGLGIR